MNDDLVITHDPVTGLLVASLPGIMIPWQLDMAGLDGGTDVDVDAYRRQLAPIIAEFKAKGTAQ